MIDKLKLSAELPEGTNVPVSLNSRNTIIRTQGSYSQPQKIHFCHWQWEQRCRCCVPQKKNRSKVRAAAIKEVEAFHQGNSGDRDTNLLGGDIVLVVDLDWQANTSAYSLPFFVAEVIGPNNGEEVLVQTMRPSDLVSIDKKFLRWQGDDNVNLLWRPIILKKFGAVNSRVDSKREKTHFKVLAANTREICRSLKSQLMCSSVH